MLSLLSPFVGAIFLRHVLHALGDGSALSWFSTILSVIATGIRPWAHLITRLENAVCAWELHTALRYPGEESLVHLSEQSDRKLHATFKHVDGLEPEL